MHRTMTMTNGSANRLGGFLGEAILAPTWRDLRYLSRPFERRFA
jgi:hypothetical protein